MKKISFFVSVLIFVIMGASQAGAGKLSQSDETVLRNKQKVIAKRIQQVLINTRGLKVIGDKLYIQHEPGVSEENLMKSAQFDHVNLYDASVYIVHVIDSLADRLQDLYTGSEDSYCYFQNNMRIRKSFTRTDIDGLLKGLEENIECLEKRFSGIHVVDGKLILRKKIFIKIPTRDLQGKTIKHVFVTKVFLPNVK